MCKVPIGRQILAMAALWLNISNRGCWCVFVHNSLSAHTNVVYMCSVHVGFTETENSVREECQQKIFHGVVNERLADYCQVTSVPHRIRDQRAGFKAFQDHHLACHLISSRNVRPWFICRHAFEGVSLRMWWIDHYHTLRLSIYGRQWTPFLGRR